MKIISIFKVGITPPQPLLCSPLIICLDSICYYYYYYYVFLENRLWWRGSNPEHVYDFHKQDDLKLLKQREPKTKLP